MSIFAKLKASKKAAKDHKAAEKQKEPDALLIVPYKHVPTHAAFDSLIGAPSSWSREDRSKIKEQHKRRSEMVMSRTPSSLSAISCMNSAAGPSSQATPLPRSSSYSSFNPTWFDKSDGGMSDTRQNRYRPQRAQRGHSDHDSALGPSPLRSKMHSEKASPAVSSGTSTNSNNSSDNLEISSPSRGRPAAVTSKSEKPQGTVFAGQDILDRLHTSTERKLGEAPLLNSAPPRITTIAPKAPVVEQKQKKQRWSLLGTKNTAAVAS